MIDNSEREEIELLLPWFAAGTLSRRDTERVERALAADPELAGRYALAREELAETIRLNETLGAPSTRAMQRLFEQIDAESPVTRGAPASMSMATRVSDFFAALTPRALAWSAAAAAVVLILQAGVIGAMLLTSSPQGARYGTASVERPATAAQGSFALIRFAPDANVSAITRFLQENKASIVDGPAEGGLYRVRIAATELPREDFDRLIAKLQRDQAVGLIVAAQ
jgi:anti-sigma factor RsiW